MTNNTLGGQQTYAAVWIEVRCAGQSRRIINMNRRQLTCQKQPFEIRVQTDLLFICRLQ